MMIHIQKGRRVEGKIIRDWCAGSRAGGLIRQDYFNMGKRRGWAAGERRGASSVREVGDVCLMMIRRICKNVQFSWAST